MRRVNWQSILICIALATFITVAFRNAVDLPFVNYDDPGYVTENPIVAQGLTWNGVGRAFTHVHGGNWHPLTSISHMLDCSLFGLNARWHHLMNVLLHAASAILLFLALRQMTGASWPSFDAATGSFTLAQRPIYENELSNTKRAKCERQRIADR